MYLLVSSPYRIRLVHGHELFENHFYRFHCTANVLVSPAEYIVWTPALYPNPWLWTYLQLSVVLPTVLTEPYQGHKKSLFSFCAHWSKIAGPQYLNTHKVQGAGSTRCSSVVIFVIRYVYTGYLTVYLYYREERNFYSCYDFSCTGK